MEALMMSLGSGWVSGVRPYFMIFALGLAGRLFSLAEVPSVLQRTDVLVIAGVLLVVDFCADKIPYLDSFWDQLHTVVRPIAGGAIGYLLGGETDTTRAIVMAIIGGGMALGAHAAKTTARAAVNLSPEPVSNAAVSLGEDAMAVAVGVLTIALPIVAGVVALILIVLGIWLFLAVRRRIRRLRDRLRRRGTQTGAAPTV